MDADESEALEKKIKKLRDQKSPDDEPFEDVFRRVRELSGEPEAREDDDTLSNLVLLDMNTNRSYKNAIFPVKRNRIIELDKQGKFVPPSTRNVFLKYYCPNAAQLILWNAEDQEAYRSAIQNELSDFFAPVIHNGGT